MAPFLVLRIIIRGHSIVRVSIYKVNHFDSTKYILKNDKIPVRV